MAQATTPFLDALAAVRPDVDPLQALLQANVESSKTIPREEERTYRHGIAEVFTIPDPSVVLYAGFGRKMRGALARAVAGRRDRAPDPDDLYVADFELVIID